MLLNARSNEMQTALHLFPAFVFNWSLRFEVPTFYVPDEDAQEPVKLELTPAPPQETPPVESYGEAEHE